MIENPLVDSVYITKYGHNKIIITWLGTSGEKETFVYNCIEDGNQALKSKYNSISAFLIEVMQFYTERKTDIKLILKDFKTNTVFLPYGFCIDYLFGSFSLNYLSPKGENLEGLINQKVFLFSFEDFDDFYEQFEDMILDALNFIDNRLKAL